MSVRIFGTHDEATIAQIERCVAAGGERGVLCADGHKGYAQPIGGVVAYRDQISISGVGLILPVETSRSVRMRRRRMSCRRSVRSWMMS